MGEGQQRAADARPGGPIQIQNLFQPYNSAYAEKSRTPVKILAFQACEGRSFRHDSLPERLRDFRKYGLLVVRCASTGMLDDLARQIAAEQADLRKVRAIPDEDPTDGAPRMDFRSVVRAFEQESAEPRVCFVGVHTADLARSLASSLASADYRDRFSALFKAKRLHLVWLLHQAGEPTSLPTAQWCASWDLDFLPPLLLAAVGTLDVAEDLLREIRRHAGLWPQDVDMARELEELVPRGVDAIRDAVRRRAEQGVELKVPDLAQVEPHARAAAFVAAHCRRVSPRAFDMLVRGLLKEIVVSRRVKVASVVAPGEPAQAQAIEEHAAAALWEEEKDQVVRRLGLASMVDEETGRVLGLPHRLAGEFAEAFRQAWPFYDQEALLRLTEARLLAEEGLPPDGVGAFVEIAGRVAVEHRSTFGARWLERIHELTLVAAHHVTEDGGFIRLTHPRVYRQRMGSLCKGLYQHSDTRSLVHQHLEQHASQGRWDLVRILRQELAHLPEFDDLYWAQQILERAPVRVKATVFGELVIEACAEGGPQGGEGGVGDSAVQATQPRPRSVVRFLRDHAKEAAPASEGSTGGVSHTAQLAAAAFHEIFLLQAFSAGGRGSRRRENAAHPLVTATRVWAGRIDEQGAGEAAEALLHPRAGPGWSWLNNARNAGVQSSLVMPSVGTEVLTTLVLRWSLRLGQDDAEGHGLTEAVITAVRVRTSRPELAGIRKCVEDDIDALRASERSTDMSAGDREDVRRNIRACQRLRDLLRRNVP